MNSQNASQNIGFWHRAKRMIDSFDHALGFLESVLIVGLLSVAVILNFAQITARYVFGFSASSLEEISVYLIVWMVFVGVVHADRLSQNISLDIVYNYVTDGAKRTLWRFCDALLAVTAFALAAYGLEAVAFSHMIGETSVSKLSAPIWVIMVVIPVSFALIGLRAAVRAVSGRSKLDMFDELELQE